MNYREQLDNLSDNDLFEINRIYIENCNYPDEDIFENGEDFFENIFGNDIMAAVRAATYGDFNYSHKYVRLNGYGNLETTNDISNFMDLDGIANDIEDNYRSYSRYIDEIEDDEHDED